jgi:hypothetical protein
MNKENKHRDCINCINHFCLDKGQEVDPEAPACEKFVPKHKSSS